MAIKILNDLLPIAEQTEVGVVKPDNVSITITETGELQSSVVDLPEDVVTAENYDNPKLWKGTLEEYNAIETKNPLVTYIITDDNVETLKTTDYNALSNKPSINDVTLEGNKTLEDLNIQAADTSLTTSQITNCITKIPQDIKLELVDGTLTLKAGSKVYDGAGNTINITSDINVEYGDITENLVYCVGKTGNYLIATTIMNCSSGATAPVVPSPTRLIWYDTTNKKVYTYNPDSSEKQEVSLPIFIANSLGDNKFELKQVFNGFGYIGDTLFTLPGVEGLIPNGRLPDGKSNNIKNSVNNILTYTVAGSGILYLSGSGSGEYGGFAGPTEQWYDFDKNMVWFNNAFAPWTEVGRVIFENGRITSLTPKNVFQAVDRNDTEWASTASKPSNRYINLTLGASGSTYAAPANGWFSLWQKDSTTSAGKITIRNKETLFGVGTENSTTGFTNLILPTHKNEQIAIYYTNITATDFQFRFIYDEGVK